MKSSSRWPKRPTTWIADRVLYISVPFTWNMPGIRRLLRSSSYLWDNVVIGGPGVYLTLHYSPGFLDGIPCVKVGDSYPGVLQRVNPLATRTTTGCLFQCVFCGVGNGVIEPGGFRELPDWPDLPVITDNNLLAASEKHFDRVIDRLKLSGVGNGVIEPGGFRELPDWPDLPVITDNNLLAASEKHFDRVIDRLKLIGWADFEQGLDPRLLTDYHAGRSPRYQTPLFAWRWTPMTSAYGRYG